MDVLDGVTIVKIPLEFTPVLIKKNKLYAMEEDQEGFQVVKRYRITWKF